MVFFSVLYNPGKNAFINIQNALRNGYIPVVYLNRVDGDYIKELESLGVVILGSNINAGLGKAFKELEEYLVQSSHKYYIYFDQDTIVSDESWKRILTSYKNYFKSSDTGMLFFGYSKKSYPNLVISSGCVFSISIIKKFGGHNEDFFVEGVDYDYCLKLVENNLKIKCIPESGIDHFSLQDGYKKKFFGFNFNLRVYGPSRLQNFNSSHLKLIKKTLKMKKPILFFFFFRSYLQFNLKEMLSRVLGEDK